MEKEKSNNEDDLINWDLVDNKIKSFSLDGEIKKGKCVNVYDRIRYRYPKYNEEDYIFYPQYKNRQTISASIQRLFKRVLDELNLRTDVFTGYNHTLYSLRHTAICMRIVLKIKKK